MRRLTCLALLASTPAFGWGTEGHRLIARIAEAQLTPAARGAVEAILGSGATLESISSWADEVRRARPETGNWHFIDIPIDQRHLNMDRDCPEGDCVLARIVLFRQILGDRAATAAEREEALKFFTHFIADMHQPLHCANNNDRGGNEVPLIFDDRQTNLHSLWDSGLLGKIGTEEELLPELSREAQRRAKMWAKGDVQDWAEQSQKAARKVVYGKLPKPVAADQPVTISTEYENAAAPVIRLQLERAGDRLARELNELFP